MVKGEVEVDEDENKARGSTSSSMSSVYLRGPTTLNPLSYPLQHPMICLDGQR